MSNRLRCRHLDMLGAIVPNQDRLLIRDSEVNGDERPLTSSLEFPEPLVRDEVALRDRDRVDDSSGRIG